MDNCGEAGEAINRLESSTFNLWLNWELYRWYDDMEKLTGHNVIPVAWDKIYLASLIKNKDKLVLY